LLFQDEARFGRISDGRRWWAPLPWRPVVGRQQVRQYLNTFVAVSPFDGARASLLCRDVDAWVMSSFLAHVAQTFRRDFCIMVLDGAGWHIAHDLEVPARMHLEFVPPHSPELNPVEPIWDYVREHYTGNHVFTTLGRVEGRLCHAFHALDATPTLVRSLTLFDWIEQANLYL